MWKIILLGILVMVTLFAVVLLYACVVAGKRSGKQLEDLHKKYNSGKGVVQQIKRCSIHQIISC